MDMTTTMTAGGAAMITAVAAVATTMKTTAEAVVVVDTTTTEEATVAAETTATTTGRIRRGTKAEEAVVMAPGPPFCFQWVQRVRQPSPRREPFANRFPPVRRFASVAQFADTYIPDRVRARPQNRHGHGGGGCLILATIILAGYVGSVLEEKTRIAQEEIDQNEVIRENEMKQQQDSLALKMKLGIVGVGRCCGVWPSRTFLLASADPDPGSMQTPSAKRWQSKCREKRRRLPLRRIGTASSAKQNSGAGAG